MRLIPEYPHTLVTDGRRCPMDNGVCHEAPLAAGRSPRTRAGMRRPRGPDCNTAKRGVAHDARRRAHAPRTTIKARERPKPACGVAGSADTPFTARRRRPRPRASGVWRGAQRSAEEEASVGRVPPPVRTSDGRVPPPFTNHQSAARAASTIWPKTAGSWLASSDSTRRSSWMLALVRPLMKRL